MKLFAVLVVVAGCGGQETGDGKANASGGTSSGSTTGSPPTSGSTSGSTGTRPTELPPSWTVGSQLGADGSAYVTNDPSQFPPALTWKDGVLQPNAGDSAPPKILSAWVSGNERVYVTATVDAGPSLPEGTIAFIADVDGPVLNSFFFPKDKACTIVAPSSGAAGLFALNVQCGDDSMTRHFVGFIAGNVGEVTPTTTVLGVFPQYATADGVFASNNGTMTLYDWTGTTRATYPGASGGDTSLAVGSAFLWIPTINVAPNTSPSLQISVLGAAPQTFLADDPTGALATDGHDMVWRNSAIELMTAPFTFDPSTVQPRKLRGPDTQLGFGPGVVGCGYHAEYLDPTMRVVRLSDATAWATTLTNNTVPNMMGSPILAVSCQEVVVNTDSGTQRIRLDSLGTPLPAGP